MTKYGLKKGLFNGYKQELIFIANELAEANRLKRLELRQIEHKLWNEATAQKLTEKELEDQA